MRLNPYPICVAIWIGTAAWVALSATSPATSRADTSAVVDADRGPSIVRDTGPSASKRGGVSLVRDTAREAVKPPKLRYPKEASVCRSDLLVTGLIKSVAFDIDAELRRAKPMSVRDEIALGDKIARDIARSPEFAGRLDTPKTRAWRAYLARVAQPLLAETQRKGITYRFHVVDAPTVNAFAIPGGHVYFYTGLLENQGGTWLANEAQLAAILAHEISHIDLGHCIAVHQYLEVLQTQRGGTDSAAFFAIAMARGAFSSNQENEADRNATRLMHLAQYAHNEFALMWASWARQNHDWGSNTQDDPIAAELSNLMRSHASSRERACKVLRQSRTLLAGERNPKRLYVGKTNFAKRTPRSQRQH